MLQAVLEMTPSVGHTGYNVFPVAAATAIMVDFAAEVVSVHPNVKNCSRLYRWHGSYDCAGGRGVPYKMDDNWVLPFTRDAEQRLT
jgi:hypothetical protein